MGRTDYVEMPFNPSVVTDPDLFRDIQRRTLEALAEQCQAFERRPLLDTLRLWVEDRSGAYVTIGGHPALETFPLPVAWLPLMAERRDVLYLIASVRTRTEGEVALDGLGDALRDTREYRLLERLVDWMARLSW